MPERYETSITDSTGFLLTMPIVSYGEGGRQIYVPALTGRAFARFARDTGDEFVIPIDWTAGRGWTEDRQAIADYADFPWEDELHLYSSTLRDTLPLFRMLAENKYRPRTDIFEFKWVLDLQDLVQRVFLPLMMLVITTALLVVGVNIWTTARIRESEFALWRILGMRVGDLMVTQILSTAIIVTVGSVAGVLLGDFLIDRGRDFLLESTSDENYATIFAPIGDFMSTIIIGTLVLGLLSSFWPALHVGRTNPASVLK